MSIAESQVNCFVLFHRLAAGMTYSQSSNDIYWFGDCAQHALAPEAALLRFTAQVKRRPLGGHLQQ